MCKSLEQFLLLPVFVCIVVGAIAEGVSTLIYGLTVLKGSNTSLRWRIIEGKILSSRLIRETCQTLSLKEFTRSIAEVRYHYTIDGERYQSSRVSFDDRVYSNERERVLSSYPQGKLVNVYVDPAKPKQAVLEPGSNGGPATYCVILGVIFIIAGVSIAWGIISSLISMIF